MDDVYKVTRSDLVSVADAIRERAQTSDQLVFPGGFVAAIEGMETGKTGATLTVTTPAEGVAVTVTKGELSYTKTTGADGTAVFSGLESGTWTITISDGSQTATGTVDIDADYAAELTFFKATINVTYSVGAVCTATDGVVTLTAPDTSGTWACIVPNAGIWTISIADMSYTWQVEITEKNQVESVDATQTYLYKNGSECTSITGGWALATNDPSGTTHGESLTKSSESMTFKASNSGTNSWGFLRAAKKIDLSAYSVIYAEVSDVSISKDSIGLVINTADRIAAWIDSPAKASLKTGCNSVPLDVSSFRTGYYVGIGASASASGTVTIKNVILLKQKGAIT